MSFAHFRHSNHRQEEKGGCFADCMNCSFFCERAHQDSFKCCAPSNKHGTSGLVAMTSASHAEGRQFDPGLVYICVFSRTSVRHCATCRRQHDACVFALSLQAKSLFRAPGDTLQTHVQGERIGISGVAQWLACWAHNPKVRGSKPRSAIF